MQSFFENRSFKFGDGFFETLVVRNYNINFLDYHYERILNSFSVLQFELPEIFSKKWINDIVIKELDLIENADASTWRVRITFWRNGAGLYTPVQHDIDYQIETRKLEGDKYLLNEKGLLLGVCDNLRISPDILSPIKSTSALHYVMAALYKYKMQFDDCILLNHNNNIVESSSSNIFVCKDGKLFTIPLSEGCIDGVCRRIIITLAQKNEIEVIEK